MSEEQVQKNQDDPSKKDPKKSKRIIFGKSILYNPSYKAVNKWGTVERVSKKKHKTKKERKRERQEDKE